MALAQITMGLEIVLEASLGGAGYTVMPMICTATLTAVARGLAMALLWRSPRWERARV